MDALKPGLDRSTHASTIHDVRERANATLTRYGLDLHPGIEPVAVLSAARLTEIAPALRAEGFLLFDISGVDYLKYVEKTPERFGITYNLYDIDTNTRLFLRVFVPDRQPLPSMYPIWKSANYLEREVYDLLGIRFEGHPDLRKILTPDDLEGHPLRKDFPLGESPTLFRDGRFLDPPSFRAGLMGQQDGLTGWRGGERKGFTERPDRAAVAPKRGEP